MHQGEHFLAASSNFIQLCKLLIETIQCIFARFWTGHGWVATQGMVLADFLRIRTSGDDLAQLWNQQNFIE